MQISNIIAKHYLINALCINCAWKRRYLTTNGNYLCCISPERLKDDRVKWVSKDIPEEQTCEFYEKNKML